MALDMTPEQREIGKANFHRAVGQFAVSRRDFMKGLLAAGAVLPVSAAAYFGYEYGKLKGNPVRAGLIGAGDEGGVLIGEHNPSYLEFVAYSDIRPSNQARIFEDEKRTSPSSPRRGFKFHYGNDAPKKIKLYEDYHKLLEDPTVEAVVIALPLHLHAPVAIDAMKAGKHVLCEKLMAWNITQCKEMNAVAEKENKILAIGHQRHYSLLYAHALEVMKSGILGDVKHIRALWHRNNAVPRLDKDGKEIIDKEGHVVLRDSWRPEVPDIDRKALDGKLAQYNFKTMEELVRWRLYNRTGGGLMAELGSHQLDACSIFLGKVHPLAVTGVGGKYFYKDDREVEDHVFVSFEFPGKNYPEDKNDVVIVTYSSINTNGFEPYGECVMGSRGSMVVEMEQNVMLYPEKGVQSRSLAVSISDAGGKPALDTAGSGPPAAGPAATGQAALGAGPVSRGYREEMEHFAYCIRMQKEGMSENDRPRPRCDGKAAMADAIIALTSNLAMRKHQRIEFDPKWFDPQSDAVPDKEMKVEVVTG